jgi:ABC-2 type transport system ATP-binding protein
VVALDSTSALIKRISGSQLMLRLSRGALPESLTPMLTRREELPSGTRYTLRVNHYNEVEPILAGLRQSGAVIEDMQLQQADLEDVFIQIMEGEK